MFMRAFFFRNGVVATPSPRITAYYAFYTQPSSVKKPVGFKGFKSVLRARRGVPAG